MNAVIKKKDWNDKKCKLQLSCCTVNSLLHATYVQVCMCEKYISEYEYALYVICTMEWQLRLHFHMAHNTWHTRTCRTPSPHSTSIVFTLALPLPRSQIPPGILDVPVLRLRTVTVDWRCTLLLWLRRPLVERMQFQCPQFVIVVVAFIKFFFIAPTIVVLVLAPPIVRLLPVITANWSSCHLCSVVTVCRPSQDMIFLVIVIIFIVTLIIIIFLMHWRMESCRQSARSFRVVIFGVVTLFCGRICQRHDIYVVWL